MSGHGRTTTAPPSFNADQDASPECRASRSHHHCIGQSTERLHLLFEPRIPGSWMRRWDVVVSPALSGMRQDQLAQVTLVRLGPRALAGVAVAMQETRRPQLGPTIRIRFFPSRRCGRGTDLPSLRRSFAYMRRGQFPLDADAWFLRRSVGCWVLDVSGGRLSFDFARTCHRATLLHLSPPLPGNAGGRWVW